MNQKSNFKSVSKSSTRSTTMFQAETPKEEAKRKITNAIRRDAGKYVNFYAEGISGLLVSACMYNNWPHFVILDKDRKPVFVKSTATFSIIKDIPGELSILDFLRRDQPEYLYEVAEEALKDKCITEKFGKIVISYDFEYRSNNNSKSTNNKNKNKSKKNNKKS